jgi:hypothetical protein
VKPEGLGGSAGFRIKFIFVDPAETLVQRGFRKSVLRKIRFSKNLDIKILRTNNLEEPVSRWADRHCLDHDRASSMGGARSDVTWGCGFFWLHRKISYLTQHRRPPSENRGRWGILSYDGAGKDGPAPLLASHSIEKVLWYRKAS